MRALMADQRALDAIARIEHALARIERAAATPPAPPPQVDEAEIARLRSAHDALRRKVAGAIGEIDLILDGEGAR
jgi:hypothetical protein